MNCSGVFSSPIVTGGLPSPGRVTVSVVVMVVVAVTVVVVVLAPAEAIVVVLVASTVPERGLAPPHPVRPAAARAHANADANRPAVREAPRAIKRRLSQSRGPARFRVSAGLEPVVQRLERVGPPEGGLDQPVGEPRVLREKRAV